MLQQPIFSKEDFIQFVMDHTKKIDDDLVFQQNPGDPLQFAILRRATNTYGMMNLHNVWESYSRLGDLNVITDFLNKHLKVNEYMRQSEAGNITINLEQVFPILRLSEMKPEMDAPLYEALEGDMETLFVENHEGHYVFLTEELIEHSLNTEGVDVVKARAFANLRAKGWNSSLMQMRALDPHRQGTFSIFQKTDYPFQHQFFLRDMTRGQLPNSFLLAVPAKDMAVVYTCSNKISSYLNAKKISVQSGFNHFVERCFESEPGPLSRNIFWIHNRGYHLLFGEKSS